MTEGGLSCILVAHEHPEKLHTVGRPAPGNLLKVLRENFQEVAPGEIGELVGKSSVVMLGYKNRPDKSSENYWIDPRDGSTWRSEEHTSELQSLMRISYAVFCLKKKKQSNRLQQDNITPREQTKQ